jgi:hypothetical protein
MDKLKFIGDQMDAIAVPYEFGEWSSDITYPYFTGETTEDPPLTEDGAEESTMILTGWCRGKSAFMRLETAKAKIKAHFDPVYGLRGDTESGAIAVFYDGGFPVPSGEAELKKIEIHLKIKEWKGAYSI